MTYIMLSGKLTLNPNNQSTHLFTVNVASDSIKGSFTPDPAWHVTVRDGAVRRRATPDLA